MRPGATKQKFILIITTLAVLSLILLLNGALSAQSGGGYDLSWFNLNGSGESFSMGGDYILGVTIGQSGAGNVTGGDYQVEGGFWHCFPLAFPNCPTNGSQSNIYLPIITSSNN